MATTSDADVRIGGDLSGLERALNAAMGKVKNFGKSVAAIGASVAAAGAVIAAPFIYGLNSFSEFGSEISSASRQTGMSFREVQDLAAGTGASFDELATATMKMSAFMVDAANGSEETRRALSDMGVSLDDLTSMSQSERMNAMADGLSRIGDEARRIDLSKAIFGRGHGALNLSGGSAGLAERAGRTADTRLSDDDVRLAKEYSAAMKILKVEQAAFWRELGAAAAPLEISFVQLITDIVREVSAWTRANRPLMATIFRIAGVLIAVGVVVTSVGGAIVGLGTAVGFVSAGFAALVPFILPAVIGLALFVGVVVSIGIAVGAAWAVLRAFGSSFSDIFAWLISFGPTLANWFRPLIDGFNTLRDIVGPAWEGVMNAISAGEFATAFEITWLAVKLIFLKGVNSLTDIWYGFKHTFMTTWEDMMSAIGPALLSAVRGIAQVFVSVANAIQEIVNGVITQIPDSVRELAGVRLINLDSEDMADRAMAGAGDILARPRVEHRLEVADRTSEGETQRALDRLEMGAWFDAQLRAALRDTPGAVGQAGSLSRIEGGTALGSFSGSALSGFGVGPLNRLVIAAERQIEQGDEANGRLAQIANREDGLVMT